MTVHTIKFSATEAVRLERSGEQIKGTLLLMGVPLGSKLLPPDFVGAVLFAAEQLGEEIEQARQLRVATQRASEGTESARRICRETAIDCPAGCTYVHGGECAGGCSL